MRYWAESAAGCTTGRPRDLPPATSHPMSHRDSLSATESLPPRPLPAAQAPAAPVDTARPARDSSPVATAPAAEPAESSAAAVPVDSGGIRLVGLPRGSTVLIDEKPITQALTRLTPGPHALAISAPRYNFYSDTVVIRPGQVQELTPQLTQIGAPVPSARSQRPANAQCVPGAGYNADGSCFDDRPKPVNPPFVTVPRGRQTGAPSVADVGQSLGRRPHRRYQATSPFGRSRHTNAKSRISSGR